MIVKKLKFPFSWEERRPQIDNGVLFIPDHYDRHTEWVLPSWEAIFGNRYPIVVEYCSGNGTWIAEKAQDKSRNWIAVEWRFDRVQKIWSKKMKSGLDNLLIVCGDAQIFIRDYLREHRVEGVYVNFPDPWPKFRHAKNRLFQTPFALHLARTVSPDGVLTVVTDDAVYGHQIVDTVLSIPSWKPSFGSPYYVTQWDGYGASYFDSLWREKGREIRYFQFLNQGLA